MQLKSDTPTVLLPIETVVRELDSKLVTASALAARGLRAIVAHKEEAWAIGAASKGVVWVGKNLFSDNSDNHHADRLARNDSAVLFLQDEGGIFQVNTWVDNVLQKHHVDLVCKRKLDRVLMWGRRQRDVFCERAPQTKPNVAVTGSPRFDLCAPTYDWMTADAAADIKARFGSYILACTRFTAVAHAEGLYDPFRRKLNPRIWPDDYGMGKVAGLWFSKWQRDVHDFADFVVLVKAIADANPARTVVLRPHPSESLRFYEHAFSAISNIVIIREGSVLSWIRSADLVVHSNCTTGIEAVLSGRPVLNFLPESTHREDTDIEVAREAGTPARSVQHALELIKVLLADTQKAHAWSSQAASMLNNLEREAVPLVVDETLAVIRERGITSSQLVPPPKRPIRRFVKRMIGRAELNAYVASKRGPLDRGHIEMIVDACHANGLGGHISEFSPQYVVIDP
jgi:surface carbohydrate biosynthesis protein